MTDNNSPFEETLANAVLDLPREFFIENTRFQLWQPTLGVSILAERKISSLNIDRQTLKETPAIEALRLASLEKEKLSQLIALHTVRDKAVLNDSRRMKGIASRLAALDDGELAQLFLLILSMPDVSTLLRETGLTQEHQKQSEIARIKNKDGRSISFGGKTIFGTLIDTACAKYGWTKDYVVWGIDLTSLRMMLADSVNSVYLSDEELKQVKLDSGSLQKFGMTKEDIEKLKTMDWS